MNEELYRKINAYNCKVMHRMLEQDDKDYLIYGGAFNHRLSIEQQWENEDLRVMPKEYYAGIE